MMAIAAAHERLYTGDDLATVPLDKFLADLCRDLGHSLGCEDIAVELARTLVPTDMAIPLALLVNELVTNAIRHGGGRCRIVLHSTTEALRLAVSDAGRGPPPDQQASMGSRILRGLTRQLNATVETHVEPTGYVVEAMIPLPQKKP